MISHETKWKRIQGTKRYSCSDCGEEFEPPRQQCACPAMQEPIAEPDDPDEDLHPLQTRTGCILRLIELADVNKPRRRGKGWERPKLTEAEMRGMRECRQTLQTLLKAAEIGALERIASDNELLTTELEQHRQKRQGHAQRLDDARIPRARKSRDTQ